MSLLHAEIYNRQMFTVIEKHIDLGVNLLYPAKGNAQNEREGKDPELKYISIILPVVSVVFDDSNTSDM